MVCIHLLGQTDSVDLHCIWSPANCILAVVLGNILNFFEFGVLFLGKTFITIDVLNLRGNFFQ